MAFHFGSSLHPWRSPGSHASSASNGSRDVIHCSFRCRSSAIFAWFFVRYNNAPSKAIGPTKEVVSSHPFYGAFITRLSLYSCLLGPCIPLYMWHLWDISLRCSLFHFIPVSYQRLGGWASHPTPFRPYDASFASSHGSLFHYSPFRRSHPRAACLAILPKPALLQCHAKRVLLLFPTFCPCMGVRRAGVALHLASRLHTQEVTFNLYHAFWSV